MKTILIGFSRPNSMKFKPFAAAIMWVDDIDYDHGFIQFCSDRWGVDFNYQSSGSRTNFMGDKYFDRVNKTVEMFAIDVPDEVESKIGKLCVDREGQPYGLKEVIGKAIVAAAYLLFKKRMQNPFKLTNTDCITEVSIILAQGLGIECPLDMNSVTVKPFRDFIASLPTAKAVPQPDVA